MKNLLATLRFRGTAYHGSQIQKNAPTVQAAFQQALGTALGSLPGIKCCSRTDAGVHANRFCISFLCADETDPAKLACSLNGILPRDIRVTDCRAVPADFHARYSATGKRYQYKIVNAPVMDPFYLDLAAHVPSPCLDERALAETAQIFVGRHDFSAFCANRSGVADRVRTISEFSVTRAGDLVVFSVTADGFLYNMARAMVGTLLNAARGKITAQGIARRLETGQRDNLCATAPACGLYLDEVFYAPAAFSEDGETTSCKMTGGLI